MMKIDSTVYKEIICTKSALCIWTPALLLLYTPGILLDLYPLRGQHSSEQELETWREKQNLDRFTSLEACPHERLHENKAQTLLNVLCIWVDLSLNPSYICFWFSEASSGILSDNLCMRYLCCFEQKFLNFPFARPTEFVVLDAPVRSA